MAIKGKRKPKSKPAARAPKRAPVQVAPPWPQRRWVQVTAAFLVGLLAMSLFVWITNGLRQNQAEADAAASASAQADAAATKLKAATAWQTAAEGAFALVGTPNQGLPPTIFADLSAAIDTMTSKGTPPADAEQTFADAQANAKKALDQLTAFDLVGTIRNQGFDELQAASFTNSKERMIEGLQLYRQAAEVAVLGGLGHGSRRGRTAHEGGGRPPRHRGPRVQRGMGGVSIGPARRGGRQHPRGADPRAPGRRVVGP